MSKVFEIIKKICTKCGEEKIENTDNFRLRDSKYIAQCLLCLKEYNSEYHKQHHQKMKENSIIRDFPEEKECTNCKIVKKLNKEKFHFNKSRNIFESQCKICTNKKANERYEEKLKEQGKTKQVKLYEDGVNKVCSKCLILKNIEKNFYKNKNNKYVAQCNDCISENRKIRLSKPENKDKKSKSDKLYRKNNKEKIKNNRKKYRNIPKNKIKHVISGSILKSLKSKNKRKNGSISNYLQYTIEELKQHLESLFEPWMNWDNHGVYNSKTWNDNDQSTWVWNIDHIKPHSHFNYESMEDEEFKKCWALENLRPYSAKLNVIEQDNR